MLKNLKLGQKIGFSFGVIILLLLVVAVAGLYGLRTAGTGFSDYRGLARDTNLAGRLQSNMLMVEMYVKDFIIAGGQKHIDEYNNYMEKVEKFAAEADENIENPERAAKVDLVLEGIGQYSAAFQDVIEDRKNRDKLVNGTLNVIGPEMEKALSEIMASANRDGDSEAAYVAGTALRHLLLARLYVVKFLNDNNETDVERVNQEFADFRKQLNRLDRNLQDKTRRNLLATIESKESEYYDAFTNTVAIILERNDRIENTLEVLGPQIAQNCEDVKLSVMNDQDILGPRLQASNGRSNATMIIVGVISLLAGVLLAFITTGMITKPVIELTKVSKQIALGNLHEEVNIKQNDEVGELADAFRDMQENLSNKAEAANAIAEGNLDIEIDVASSADVLGHSMVKVRESLMNLTREIKELVKAADYGRLNYRTDANQFGGEYHDIATGINKIVDKLVGYLDNAPIPFMIIDDDFTISYMNKVGADLGNTSGEALTGEKCYNYFKTSDCKTKNCACSRAMSTKETAVGETDAHPGNHNLEISYYGSPIINQEGEVVGAAEFVLDQTEIKTAQKKANKVSAYQAEEVKNLTSVLSSMAEGDLTVEYKPSNADEDTKETKETFAGIANALAHSLHGLNDTLSQVDVAIEQVSNGATQVSGASQSLSQGATEQAASLEEVSASITQIGGQTKLNSDTASQANKLAISAGDAARMGNKHMEQMLTAMTEINDSSSQVQKIIKVIDEIAFQTNLLALNAAVEAARAGAHGKGFAVVAEEVRSLAQRSAKAARETTELIEGSVARTENGGKIAEETAQSLNEINESVTKVVDLIADINAASLEQTTAIDEISDAVGQIDQVTQANTANAEESAAASEELAGQATNLREMISTFTLANVNIGSRIPGNGSAIPRMIAEYSGSNGTNGHGTNGNGTNGNGLSKDNHNGNGYLKTIDDLDDEFFLEDSDFGKF